MRATKIKMRPGFAHVDETPEIAKIYIDGCDCPGFYPVDQICAYVREHPGSICVDVPPHPKLIPIKSKMHGDFVRSARTRWERDLLFDLPRE